MSEVAPHLWYSEKAGEAAKFYASMCPDSRIDTLTTIPADTPSGPAGSVEIVEFTLCGQSSLAIGAGRHDLAARHLRGSSRDRPLLGSA